MKINREVLHYKIYRSTYTNFGCQSPEVTNLCQYVRRLMVFLMIVYPVLMAGGLFLVVMMALMTLVLTPIYLVLGLRPQMPWENGYSPLGHKPWTPLMIKGFGFRLVYLAIPVVLYYLGRYDYHAIHDKGFLYPPVFIQGLFVVVAVIAIGLVFRYDTETGKLAGDWWEAKTKGICPLISFEGPEPKDDDDEID